MSANRNRPARPGDSPLTTITIDEVISVQQQIDEQEVNNHIVDAMRENPESFEEHRMRWTPPKPKPQPIQWFVSLYENGNFSPVTGTLRQVLAPFVRGHAKRDGCKPVVEGLFLDSRETTEFTCSDCGDVIVYLKYKIGD